MKFSLTLFKINLVLNFNIRICVWSRKIISSQVWLIFYIKSYIEFFFYRTNFGLNHNIGLLNIVLEKFFQSILFYLLIIYTLDKSQQQQTLDDNNEYSSSNPNEVFNVIITNDFFFSFSFRTLHYLHRIQETEKLNRFWAKRRSSVTSNSWHFNKQVIRIYIKKKKETMEHSTKATFEFIEITFI